jgi:hypothetical protein
MHRHRAMLMMMGMGMIVVMVVIMRMQVLVLWLAQMIIRVLMRIIVLFRGTAAVLMMNVPLRRLDPG